MSPDESFIVDERETFDDDVASSSRKNRLLWGGIVMVGIVMIGVIVFLLLGNFGTLVIEGQGPFQVRINNDDPQICQANICSFKLIPGEYSLVLEKELYYPMNTSFSVPLWGEHREVVNFSFIPMLSLRENADRELLFGAAVVPDFLERLLPEDTPVFLEKNYAAFVRYDEESGRQALFITRREPDNRSAHDASLAPFERVTSFIRTITDYTIVPAVEKYNALLFIERASDGSRLYLIDRAKKSRHVVVSMPFIQDGRWLDEEHALLLAQNDGDDFLRLYVLNVRDGSYHALSLLTSLDLIIPWQDGEIFALTTQNIGGIGGRQDLQGQLVTLADTDVGGATEVFDGLRAPLQVVLYNLARDESRLLFYREDFGEVEKMVLGENGKTLLLLVADQVYQLQFSE